MLHSDLLQLPHRCRYNWSSVLIMHIRCQAVRVSLFSCFVPLKDHFCTLPRTCISQPGSGTVSTTSWCALLFVRYFLSSCSICPLSSCKCIPFSSFLVKRNLMQEMLLNEKLLCATQISLLYYSSLKPTFAWT